MYCRFISAAAVAVTVFMLCISSASAQHFLENLKITPQNDALHISMLFHKMAGFQPDFKVWIENSDEYKRTPKQQRYAYMNERTDIYHDYYARVNVDDPIVVQVKTHVPPYDREKGGFLIEGMEKDKFFSYEHEGGHFAVVPTDIMDYQWFIMPEDRLTNAPYFNKDRGGAVIFHFHLRPKSIDTSTSYLLEGSPHWLIATEIVEIQMWNQYNKVPLWVMYKKTQ